MHEKNDAKSFQDPAIRPDVNLQFVGGLALVLLPLLLIFMVLSKEPTQPQAKSTLFKPVVTPSWQHP